MPKFGFNPSEVVPQEPMSFELLPRGEYTLRATDAEERPTKNNGELIAVTFEVADGSHQGRKIWFQFNTKNASEQAERIGHQQLVAWATACGKPEADDTDDLLERPFQANIVIEKGTNGYADKNKIASFLFSKAKAKTPVKKSEPPKKETNGGSKWKID
tara:strand:+ start:1793 stop:2269 length:477 start_codon:yes stop_codon:yes gene_type:complete